MSKCFVSLVSVVLGLGFAHGQDWEREGVDFGMIESRARDLANREYVEPDKESLPEWMKALTYDQYRDIRFDPQKALWGGEEKLPFRAMFFHPGYLFREPVGIHEFTDTHRQRVRLSEAFFNYGPLIKNHGELPADGGFAGFRLHAPLNDPNVFDELVVFQGASSVRGSATGFPQGASRWTRGRTGRRRSSPLSASSG